MKSLRVLQGRRHGVAVDSHKDLNNNIYYQKVIVGANQV